MGVHFSTETNTAMYCGAIGCHEIYVDPLNVDEYPKLISYDINAFGAFDMYFNADYIIILYGFNTEKYQRDVLKPNLRNVIEFGGLKFAKGSEEKNESNGDVYV